MYIEDSRYHESMAVTNNSLIVSNSYKCHECEVNVYCYSNTTSSNVGYVIFPNGGRVYNDRDYHDISVYRVNPSGMHFYNYRSYTIDYSGIYTCELPDTEGNTLEASVGIYESTPSMIIIANIIISNHCDVYLISN